MKALIIAEAGLNHCGRLADALLLADAARAAGADIVKFQTFHPWSVPEGIRHLALKRGETYQVARHCENIGIEFCSTPEDVASLTFLMQSCGVKRIKIGSGSLLYRPLLEAAYATKKPVLLSTGMARLDEIKTAINGFGSWGGRLTLMHCVSLYPCPDRLANVRALNQLRWFECPVGYSDHTIGAWSAMLAVALGADVIEKHLTLDGDQSRPDWNVSLNSNGFRDYITLIREAETLAGDGMKAPSPEECASIPALRKLPDGTQPAVPGRAA